MSELLASNNERQIDTDIASKVFGNEVKWWSLHYVNSEAELEGKEWRKALFTELAFAQGGGAEVYLPGKDGDMAAPYMKLGTGEWVPLPKYLDDDSYFTEIIEAIVEDGQYKVGLTYQRDSEDEATAIAAFLRAGEGIAFPGMDGMWMGKGPTMHLAMCAAALNLVMELEKDGG